MEQNNTISLEVYKLLESADWGSLGSKMLARAVWRGKTRYGVIESTLLANGLSIEDVPSYIIQSAFEGTRKWNPSISLETWSLNQVDSVMDWFLNLRANRDKSYSEADSSEEDDEEFGQTLSDELEIVLRCGPATPEEIYIKRLEENEAKELYNALYDEIENIPELQELMLATMDADEGKPGVVAEMLNIPVEEVYVLRRRLKRHLEKISKKIKKASYEKNK
jgi:DNA-directed RNA polymerase specialized sigma24 family protein